jgi:predicted transcriptional regulator
MTKIEQLTSVAQQLSDDQVADLLALAQSMAEAPFYDRAPPEALASIERGLAQIARGEDIALEEYAKRLDALMGTARK